MHVYPLCSSALKVAAAASTLARSYRARFASCSMISKSLAPLSMPFASMTLRLCTTGAEAHRRETQIRKGMPTVSRECERYFRERVNVRSSTEALRSALQSRVLDEFLVEAQL